jgi:hypothetical protein
MNTTQHISFAAKFEHFFESRIAAQKSIISLTTVSRINSPLPVRSSQLNSPEFRPFVVRRNAIPEKLAKDQAFLNIN